MALSLEDAKAAFKRRYSEVKGVPTNLIQALSDAYLLLRAKLACGSTKANGRI